VSAPTSTVITDWSAISPFGLGSAAFSGGVRARLPATVPVDPDLGEQPVDTAGLVPRFDARSALGPANTRSMDRATALAVATVGLLLERFGPAGRPDRADSDVHVGLVLGTSNGSVDSMMGFTRDSMTMRRPYHVDPARFPNTVMNCAAGRCAIQYGLRGPNTTIAGGHVTGLLALNYAVRLHRCGHARTLLCGAVEEYSPSRAWLEWHAHGDRDAACGLDQETDTAADPHQEADAAADPASGAASAIAASVIADSGPGARARQPLGEGCAAFRLESEQAARDGGRRVRATLLALEFGVSADGHPPEDVLARCLTAVFTRADQDELWAVAPAGYHDERGGQERSALDRLRPAGHRVLPPVAELIGDTSAASAAFQLAALLAEAERDPAAAGRLGLVTTIDREGLVGCALLRLA
jgi:3-oxoacyl-[acyl-carrier-protein] synthase II